MFYHKNWNHLAGNLVGLLISGLPVFNEFGPKGLYAIFLGSGIFAAIQQKDVSLSAVIRHNLAKKNPFPQSWRLFSSPYEKLISWLASLSPPSLKVSTRDFGCSCGVHGLIAASCCTQIKNAMRVFTVGILENVAAGKDGRPMRKLDVKFLINYLGALFFYELCTSEYTVAQQVQDPDDAGYSVGHAGHVSGIKFGLTSFIYFTLHSVFGRLQRRQPPDGVDNHHSFSAA